MNLVNDTDFAVIEDALDDFDHGTATDATAEWSGAQTVERMDEFFATGRAFDPFADEFPRGLHGGGVSHGSSRSSWTTMALTGTQWPPNLQGLCWQSGTASFRWGIMWRQ